MMAEPHVRPPPKAVRRRLSPGFGIASFSMSTSVMGMVAAEVLPYLWMVLPTRSQGILNRFAVASMIRILAWWGTSQEIASSGIWIASRHSFADDSILLTACL